MALINLNSNGNVQTAANANPVPSAPPVAMNAGLPPIQSQSENSLQTNRLGENMPLRESLQVQVNNTGVKEFQPINQNPQTSNIVQGTDISANLDQKLTQIQNQLNPQTNEQAPTIEGLNTDMGVMTLQDILKRSIVDNASDIHLTTGYRPILRIDGKLKNLNAKELTPELMETYCREMIKGRQDVDFAEFKQLDMGYSFEGRRFRINIFKQMGNLSLVARIITNDIKTLDELELPPIVKELTKVPAGLILVTGPTGSGKSTTLASILNHINTTRAEHIITLEDPIEFVFPKGQSLIDQRELGQDFNQWTDALRAMLRQDPNVVLVGEMRDFETIASTITVSETGHLVFATLHTNSAAQTIDRIIDVFPEAQQSQIRTQLASVLMAVIAQRLVPLPRGGRKAVMEVMIATPAVKNAIREGKTHQIDNMIQTGQDYGMITMEKSLVELIKKGIISIETAKSVSIKPDELDILLSQA